uniref:BTB domain-containing protein n=1 Tax=Setaria digitata TaxID=48799 RepID=A0A915Q397_9BILA
MSETTNSSTDQCVVEEVSRRRRISKNCSRQLIASSVIVGKKSSTTDEKASSSSSSSATPISTCSTNSDTYESIDIISSDLNISSISQKTTNAKATAQQRVTRDEQRGMKRSEIHKVLKQTCCNATVVLDRNTVITIDRKEFAQISPYFRAAFYGGFSETKSKLLSFNRTKILDIASYLLIDPLLTLISDVIISKVNADSLVLAYHKAENRHVPLAQKLWRIIVREFDRLLVNNAFLSLSEMEILKLLHDKHLNINKNEETAMVRKWITANDCDGGGAVRLREELRGRNDTVGFSETEPRLPNSVLLARGWSNIGPTMLVETFDSRAQRWVRSELKLFEMPRAYHAVINTGEHLFTIGGFNGAEYYRSTRRFSLNDQNCIEVAPMYDQRCYVGCGLLDPERIIAIGGYNNHDRLRSAEILHIPKNQWHRIAEMSVRRSDGHCVIMKNVAYAVGGFDGMNCHASVEYYEPQRDRWFIMSNNMTSRRSGVGAAAIEGVVFICGGFDGTSRLQTCEFIDAREGKWHRLRSMNRPRSNFGIEVLNNQVVVAGGYGGLVGTIGETEAYDFRSNTWIELPTMSLRRSALYLTRVENHDIIEAFVRPKSSSTQ